MKGSEFHVVEAAVKVLLAATPLTGHVNPLLAVGRLLADRGDTIIVVTDPSFAVQVAAAGFRFAACPDYGAAGYLDRALTPGPERWTHEFVQRFIDPMPAQAARLRDLIADEAPDVIIAGSLFLGVLPLLQSTQPRPPIVVLNVSVLFLDRPDGAPVGLGLPPARNEAERAEYGQLGHVVEKGFVLPVRQQADERLGDLGLPPLPASLTQSIVALPDAFLQQGVPDFEFDFWTPPPNLRFVGLLPLDRSSPMRPPWWDELDGDRRVVLVTQGTLANGDLSELVEPTLAALSDRHDLLVAVTTGGRPIDALTIPLPANARLASFLPFDAIFPKVDAFVTNGGYGSVLQSLAAGVPIVAAGKTEDKAEVAARIGWSGVGLDLATNTPTASAIRVSVDRILSERSFRQRARRIAARFAASHSGCEIIQIIDAVVDGRELKAAGTATATPGHAVTTSVAATLGAP